MFIDRALTSRMRYLISSCMRYLKKEFLIWFWCWFRLFIQFSMKESIFSLVLYDFRKLSRNLCVWPIQFTRWNSIGHLYCGGKPVFPLITRTNWKIKCAFSGGKHSTGWFYRPYPNNILDMPKIHFLICSLILN